MTINFKLGKLFGSAVKRAEVIGSTSYGKKSAGWAVTIENKDASFGGIFKTKKDVLKFLNNIGAEIR